MTTPPYAARAAQAAAPTQKIQRQNYQPVILVEYIACVGLTAITPIATRQNQGTPGLSPYAGKDIVQLAAITVLYLILAMMSVGGRGLGRVAAWIGALVLIVDGMYEASNLVKDFGLFTGALASAAGGSTPAEGVGTPNSGEALGTAGNAQQILSGVAENSAPASGISTGQYGEFPVP